MSLLSAFVNKYVNRKTQRIGKSTHAYADVPDGKDRNATLLWLSETILFEKFDSVSGHDVALVVLYCTSQEVTTNDADVLQGIREYCLPELLGNAQSHDKFFHSFTKTIKDYLLKGFGDMTITPEVIPKLFVDIDTHITEMNGIQIKIDNIQKKVSYYFIYCIMVKGIEYVVLQKDDTPFHIGHRFNKIYEFYKKNPPYIFATFHYDLDSIRHNVCFVIDSSSELENGRLFWSSKRNEMKLIPADKVQYLSFFSQTGQITYLDENLGMYKGKKSMFLLYTEVKKAQQSLWKQSQQLRELEKLSKAELDSLAQKSGLDLYYKENRGGSKLASQCCLCGSNISEYYEDDLVQGFVKQDSVKFYFEAVELSTSQNCAILYASEPRNTEKEVHIDLFCKNKNVLRTPAPRILFAYAIKVLSQDYEYISLEAVPMAIPFYEAFGFIKVSGRDDWIMATNKMRSTKRLFDASAYREERESKRVK